MNEEIKECILKEDISTELKTKLEEKKDENDRHPYPLYLLMTNLESKDKEIIRKCRREVYRNMRELFRNRRFDDFINRTRYRYHPFLHERFMNHTNPLINEERRPEMSQRPPEMSRRPPEMSQRPPLTSQRPPLTSQRPAETSQRPPVTSQRPAETSQRPPETSQRTPETSQKPPETSQKPPETSQKTPETSQKPTESTKA